MTAKQHVDEARDTIVNVIGRAKSEVLISSGKLASVCYESPVIIGAIRDAKARDVRFRVITGPELDLGSEQAIALLRDDIYLAPRPPIVHFTVADGKHIRFETHDLDEYEETENQKRLNDSYTGTYLRTKFYEALRQTRKYNPEEHKKEVVKGEKGQKGDS